MSYDAYKRNLSGFIAALPKTGVRFMYFQRRNLGVPIVNTALSAWDIGRVQCFIIPSDQPNYCYVYRKSIVKYMISLHPADPSVAESAASGSLAVPRALFVGYHSAQPELANHGDHVTFGFIRKQPDRIILKTHKTRYSEIAGFKFDRSTQGECNFRSPASDSAEAESRDRFVSILCDTENKRRSLKSSYKSDPLVPDIVYTLYRIVSGLPPVAPVVLALPDAQVHTGARGGAYRIGRNGRKKYQQRAGTAPDYKGIGFISPAFTRFLSETIFQPVASQRPDLVSVQVFFDELSELGRDTNRTILILYDFEEDERNVFYIQTETALAAVYAAEHPAEATAYETACLQQFLAAVAHPETGLAASVAPL